MTNKSATSFRHKVLALTRAMKIHGGHLTIHPDGVYLNKKGETLANTWEDVGECLGESWDEFFGGFTDEQSIGT